ncbi:hypothetical protein MNBD_GAMMA12-2651 [hydrothermal vent metagenome]|uniref:Uncharacterized protein n=1 Tax=hydrothermal vent metagenome TaxID=652676 RepID=A0A3B0Y8P1_9ZZZZ
MTNFCGTVIDMSDSSSPYSPMIDLSKKTVYMCGDISTASSVDLKVAKRVFIIEQLSHSINNSH